MLVIFDWDGTLADSTDHIVAALQATICELASELELADRSDRQCKDQIGLGLREATLSLYPELNYDHVTVFCEHYSRNYLSLAQQQFQLCLYDGALSVMHQLRDMGCQLAVATGKSRKGLDRVLSELKLAEQFIATRAADETASKPDPQMLEELLEETGYVVQDAVMIGDSSYDMAMARAIDMPSVGVSYGVHDADILARYRPIGIVDHINEIPERIESLMN